MDINQSTQRVVEDYLRQSSILIIDSNSSVRVGLKKTMTSMGTPMHQIYSTGSFEEAKDLISKHLPQVILCDYQIDGHFGIELLQKQKEGAYKNSNKNVFIVITSNTSQSAVAQAAEEDIDAYVLKPYTLDGLRHSISRSILAKIRPSEYIKTIEAGKELLEQKHYEQALKVFQEAIIKDSRPSLACYYEGLTLYIKNSIENSKLCYQKGLTFNRIHYKCQVGLIDLLVSTKRHEEAYLAIRQVIRFFPANPKRLSLALKLAIQTKNYADVESFYQDFLKLEERNDQMTSHICAAMLICSKFFFKESQQTVALDLIQKAVVTSAGNHSLLRKAVEILIENGHTDAARTVIKRFSRPVMDEVDFAVSSFLIYSKENDYGKIISQGMDLINKGIIAADIFRITIESLEKSNKKERAEEIRAQAINHYPELEHEFKQSA